MIDLLEELNVDLGGQLLGGGSPASMTAEQKQALADLLSGANEGETPEPLDGLGSNIPWESSQFPRVEDNREKAHPLVQPYFDLREKAMHSEAIGEALYNQDDLVAAALGSFQPDQLAEFVTLRCGFARPLSDDHIRLIEKRAMRITDWLGPEHIAIFLELFCTYSRDYNVKVKTLKTLTELLPKFAQIDFRAINSIIETANVAKFPLTRRVGSHLYNLLRQYSDNGDQWEEDVDVYFSDEEKEQEQQTA